MTLSQVGYAVRTFKGVNGTHSVRSFAQNINGGLANPAALRNRRGLAFGAIRGRPLLRPTNAPYRVANSSINKNPARLPGRGIFLKKIRKDFLFTSCHAAHSTHATRYAPGRAIGCAERKRIASVANGALHSSLIGSTGMSS
jgi:hypothetical protein